MASHYVYRIDRPSTGEFYFGIRTCKCEPQKDTYMGSGRVLKDKMAGRQSEFTKTILVIVETRDEARRIEAALVGPDQIKNPLCLNVALGGDRGYAGVRVSDSRRKRMSQVLRGTTKTEAHKKKISDALKGKMTEAHRAKIVAANKRRALK